MKFSKFTILASALCFASVMATPYGYNTVVLRKRGSTETQWINEGAAEQKKADDAQLDVINQQIVAAKADVEEQQKIHDTINHGIAIGKAQAAGGIALGKAQAAGESSAMIVQPQTQTDAAVQQQTDASPAVSADVPTTGIPATNANVQQQNQRQNDLPLIQNGGQSTNDASQMSGPVNPSQFAQSLGISGPPQSQQQYNSMAQQQYGTPQMELQSGRNMANRPTPQYMQGIPVQFNAGRGMSSFGDQQDYAADDADDTEQTEQLEQEEQEEQYGGPQIMDQRSSGSNQYVQQQRPRGQYN